MRTNVSSAARPVRRLATVVAAAIVPVSLVALAPVDVGGVTTSIASAATFAAPFDFNGDGFADLAVGAYGEAIGSGNSGGAVSVIYGSATGLTAIGNQIWSVDSPGIAGTAQTSDNFGVSVTSADFNGDGFADLAIGSSSSGVGNVPYAGVVHVLFGSAVGLTAAGNQRFAQGFEGMVDVAEENDKFGYALDAGDLGNGAYPDLVIGVPGENGHQGAVNVLYGSSAGLSVVGAQAWSQDSPGILEVAEVDDYFGWVFDVADVSGDGFADLIVGVGLEDLGTLQDAGVVQIVLGGPTGLTAAADVLWSLDTPGVPGVAAAGDRFGAAVVAADFGGSEGRELAVGAPGEDGPRRVDDGAVYVFPAAAGGLGPKAQVWSQDSPGVPEVGEQWDRFGEGLAAGNMGFDRSADLAISTQESLGGQSNPDDPVPDDGTVTVLYGSPTGLASNNSQLWHQEMPGVPGEVGYPEGFGQHTRVANYGRDSYAELVSGSPRERTMAPLDDTGAVTVIYGSSTGLTATGSESWTQDVPGMLEQIDEYDYFGVV